MSRYPADLSSHSTQQVSGLDKCIFQNIDVTFPIQPSIHLGEKANTFFINASPHHDTTTSLFHCWLVTLLVGWLHSSITPIQKKLDSSLKIIWDQCSTVQSLWVRANSRRAFL